MRARTYMLVIAGLAAAGCSKSQAPPEPPARADVPAAPPAEAPEVLWSGCAAVRSGPVCEIDAGHLKLRLWTAASAGELRVTHEGVALEARALKPAEGRLVEIALPAEAAGREGTLELALAGHAPWKLALAPALTDPRLAAALDLRREGKLEEARARLGDPERYPEPLKGLAWGTLARLELAGGDLDAVMAAFERSIAHHRSQGRASDEVRDANAASWVQTELLRRFGRAAELLDPLERLRDTWPEVRFWVPYQRGIIALRSGDLRRQLRYAREAERFARRLDLSQRIYLAVERKADALLELGRRSEALAILQGMDPATLEPCDRGQLSNNTGWTLLMMRGGGDEAERQRATKARANLDRALAEFTGACKSVSDELNVRINLALADLQLGAIEEARAELARAAALKTEVGGTRAAWMLDLQARVDLRSKAWEAALGKYDELVARGEAAAVPMPIWRGQLGRGQALEGLGRLEAAVEAYRAAEATIDAFGLSVPLGEGRASFFSERDTSARRLVDALVALERVEEAAGVARISRARALASMRRMDRLGSLTPAQRTAWEEAIGRYHRERKAIDDEAAEDWKLPKRELEAVQERRAARRAALGHALDDAFALLGGAALAADALPKPAADEAILTYYPSTEAGRWYGFAITAGASKVVELSLPTEGSAPARWAQALLAPFAAEIDRAKRLKFVPYGRLRTIDFHALPWREGVLIDTRVVTYGVDLPAAAVERAPERSAVLVVDPRSDLPWALAEGKAVKARLGRAWNVKGLPGDRATKGAVTKALGAASLLHFAGHGVFAGQTGFESTLELADGGQLSVGDILALPKVPRHAVLSGCETGKTVAGAGALSVSLAHSFVAAGSQAVVAAVRPVEDELAGTMAEALYADAQDPEWDLVGAFPSAQRQARLKHPTLDWSAYRVITR